MQVLLGSRFSTRQAPREVEVELHHSYHVTSEHWRPVRLGTACPVLVMMPKGAAQCSRHFLAHGVEAGREVSYVTSHDIVMIALLGTYIEHQQTSFDV